MNIKRIRAEQFKSFPRLDFAVPSRPGLYLVAGENRADPGIGANGAGKSTIVDALSWALTGRTTRGVSGPSIEPWGGLDRGRRTLVEVEAEEGVWERRRHPIEFLADGEHADPDRDSAPREALAELIVHAQFGQTFMDLAPADKMAAFSRHLELEGWVGLSDRAKEDAKGIEGEVRRMEGSLQAAEEALSEAEAELESCREELAGAKEEESAGGDGIKALEGRLRRLNAEADEAEAEESRLKDEADAAAEAVREIGHEIDLAERDQGHAGRDRDAAEAEMRGIDDWTGDCPVCLSRLDPESAHADRARAIIGRRLDEAVDRLKGLEEGLAADRERRTALLDASKGAGNAWRAAGERASEANGRARAAEDELRRLEREADEARGRLKALREREGAIKERAAAAARRAESLRSDLAAREDDLVNAEFWVKGFRRIRLMTMSEAADALASLTTKTLGDLGLPGWRVSFEMEAETRSGGLSKRFHAIVHAPGLDEAVPWAAWSGGETQRLRIAASTAYSDLMLAARGLSPSVEFWDEPTAHLSEGGVRDLLEFLSARAAAARRAVIIIDHRSPDHPFAGIGEVVKDEDGRSSFSWT